VDLALVGMAWEKWVDSVERVTKVSFSLIAPNPGYEDSPFIEQIVEIPNAQTATVTLTNSGEGGIDTDAEMVRQAVAHVREHRGGSFSARAINAAGQVRRWFSKKDSQPVQLIAEPNERGEPSDDALVLGLEEPEAERTDDA
jgi:hypothetical protein